MDNLVFDVTLVLVNKDDVGIIDTFQVDDFANVDVCVDTHRKAANTLGFEVTMLTVTSRQED